MCGGERVGWCICGGFYLIGTASVIYILLMGYWVEYWLAMIWAWRGQWRDMYGLDAWLAQTALRSAGPAHSRECLLGRGSPWRAPAETFRALVPLLSFFSFPPPSSFFLSLSGPDTAVYFFFVMSCVLCDIVGRFPYPFG